MTTRRVEAWMRQATTVVSRRASLLTLGGAALAAGMSRPEPVTAQTRCKKRCRKMRKQCRAATEAICQGDTECLDILLRCCTPLADCDGAGVAECYLPFIFRG